MSQKIHVQPDSMYEMARAMHAFASSMETLEHDVEVFTRMLDTAMPACSRREEVTQEVRHILRDLGEETAALRETERDVLARAATLEAFERGEGSSGGWRDDRI